MSLLPVVAISRSRMLIRPAVFVCFVHLLVVGTSVYCQNSSRSTHRAELDAAENEAITTISISASDVISAYRQNVSAFPTVRITSHYVIQHGPNFFNGLRRAIRNVENKLRDGRVSAAERAQLQQSLEVTRKILSAPENRQPRAFHQQFWTDYKGFQLRFPNSMGAGIPVGESVEIAIDRFSEAAACDAFANIYVANYSGEPTDGIPIWTGIRGGAGTGHIYIEAPRVPDFWFPPLSVMDFTVQPDIYRLDRVHPFDVFFAKGEDNLYVRGFETILQTQTVVVERVTESSLHDGYIPVERLEEYRGRIREISIERAWIDLERGALPLRMEFTKDYRIDGAQINGASGFGPLHVIHDVQIQSIEQGGYYPTHIVEEMWDADMSGPGPDPNIVEIIEGAVPSTPRALRQCTEFHASEVTAGLDMEGMFSDFHFPEGTVYGDQRTAQSLVAGDGGRDKLLRDVAGGAAGTAAAVDPFTIRSVFIFVNTLLLVGIAIALWWKK